MTKWNKSGGLPQPVVQNREPQEWGTLLPSFKAWRHSLCRCQWGHAISEPPHPPLFARIRTSSRRVRSAGVATALHCDSTHEECPRAGSLDVSLATLFLAWKVSSRIGPPRPIVAELPALRGRCQAPPADSPACRTRAMIGPSCSNRPSFLASRRTPSVPRTGIERTESLPATPLPRCRVTRSTPAARGACSRPAPSGSRPRRSRAGSTPP